MRLHWGFSITLLRILFVAPLLACRGGAPVRAKVDEGGLSRAERVLGEGTLLWVGAHPDDELFIAPLLERLCERRRCVWLVLTQGEAGRCALASGCTEGMPVVRARELAESARRLRAEVVAWDLGDGRVPAPVDVEAAWTARAGSSALLAERMREVLRAVKPAALITFDPRHGVTCHPAHRVAGWLALEAAAAEDLPAVNRRFVVGSRRRLPPEDGSAAAWMGMVAARAVSATVWHHVYSPVEWQTAIEVMRLHPSQFSAVQVELATRAPPEGRELVLLPAADAPADALRTREACP